jgi:hypothetical protein
MALIFEFCQRIQEQPSSIALRESVYMYPLVESVHVLSLCVFLGLVGMMDLRLAGIGNSDMPVSHLQRQLFPWQMVGLVLMVGSGVLLFYAEPLRFYGNVFFRAKFVMMGLAVINAAVFHFGSYKNVAAWDFERVPPRAVRFAGVCSLVLWVGIVFAGRLIAYNWFK